MKKNKAKKKNSINYLEEAEKFRPKKIKTLLVGEAPPSNGKTYFYVPRKIAGNRPVESDSSLPTTIFNHYFRNRPATCEEYMKLLNKLKEKGIFLIDIYDKSIQVRGNTANINLIAREIPKLRTKMKKKKINIKDENIIFLLARRNYKNVIRKHFPEANIIEWKCFRIKPQGL